ncbi:hypothetical protein C8A00DRAFT_11549 [Chaetomidium leptoderma]|uniref:ABM domain-containing protein n=1 Tax=Chaetomidium leptoderma TaxID=669021 RepID=A0AAN6VW66_9PEZI|nr:hypothetical protein C8A00DRAFT_11549 [Chaetomidium leptoderma]
MPVTEFALLQLSQPTPLTPHLRSTLASAMAVQDGWHAAAFPDLPSSARDRAAVWFAQVEDPSQILTTARWPSVDAHWSWIRSAENRGVMAALHDGDGHVVAAADTVLFHVEGDLFGDEKASSSSSSSSRAGTGTGVVPLLESAVVSVGRVFVARQEREAFAAKFEEVRGVLEAYASPNQVRFGWRQDGEEEGAAGEDEFVLVCGWESVEKHFGFAESRDFARYGELRELIARVDLKHYKRLSLE